MKKSAIVAALVPLWCLQYILWVPVVGCWRLMVTGLRAGTKLGLVGIALICLPVIGWIILGVIVMFRSSNRNADRRHVETLAAMGVAPATTERASVWRPWLWHLAA